MAPPIKPLIYVCLLPSVSKKTWLRLACEVAPYSAIFVLPSLPKNSLQGLFQIFRHLRKQGMNIPMQIDPTLFKRFQINETPIFLFRDETGIHKIDAHVSLDNAFATIEKMAC